jgi:DNA-binding response OmpR family regulator
MGIDVLIVDDDVDLRGPLAELFREEGYVVEELGSADGFCEALETWEPALVLLDLTLPGADLHQVMKDAEARHLTEGRTMLALSGLDDALELAEELGLQGAIRKPFDIEDMLAQVGAALRKHQRWEHAPHHPPGL